MIYNFAELLKNQFPSEVVYVNGRILIAGQESIPVRNILVVDSGGAEQPFTFFGRHTVQILTRDVDPVLSRQLAMDIYTFLRSRFGLILPSVVVNSIVYPEIETAQISAIQFPYLLGPDSEGGIEYTTNYQIVV